MLFAALILTQKNISNLIYRERSVNGHYSELQVSYFVFSFNSVIVLAVLSNFIFQLWSNESIMKQALKQIPLSRYVKFIIYSKCRIYSFIEYQYLLLTSRLHIKKPPWSVSVRLSICQKKFKTTSTAQTSASILKDCLV